MNEKQAKLVHLIYGITLSLLIAVLGVCFTIACLNIYKSAEVSPFTPEAIKAQFNRLIIPTALTVVAIIAGGLLHIFVPGERKKLNSFIEDKVIIKNLSKRIDLNDSPKAFVDVIKSQRRFRLIFLIVTIANALIGTSGAFVYLFTASNYKEVNAEDFQAVLIIILTTLSYAAIPIFVTAIYYIFASFTYEKELEAVRAIVEYNAKNKRHVSKKEEICEKSCFFKKHKKPIKIVFQCILLVLSVTLILLGFLNVSGTMNEFDFVTSIANRICTGCIGLG